MIIFPNTKYLRKDPWLKQFPLVFTCWVFLVLSFPYTLYSRERMDCLKRNATITQFADQYSDGFAEKSSSLCQSEYTFAKATQEIIDMAGIIIPLWVIAILLPLGIYQVLLNIFLGDTWQDPKPKRLT